MNLLSPRGLCAALIMFVVSVNALEEVQGVRLFGLGVGVVLIAFFGSLALLVCCIGLTTSRPCCFGLVGSAMFSIVLFFLLAAQKGPRYVQTVVIEEPKFYDSTYYPRVLIFSIMVIAVVFSGLHICCVHMNSPLHARPVYDKDSTPRQRPIY